MPAAAGSVGPLGRALLADPRPAVPRGRHGRRVAVGGLLLALVCFAGAAAYAWQVTAALREAEQAIVVPLPAEPVATPTSAVPEPGAAASPVAEAPTHAPPDPVPTPPDGGQSQFSTIGSIVGAATGGEDPGRDPVWGGKRYLNVLVLGFDSREGDRSPPRSDVFMLAQLDLQAKRINVVSIPRDLWVTVPGYGEERINAAYPLGWRQEQPSAGVALVRRTVEQTFGVPIDYYIAVDFRGFQRVVDAVGGVDIDVPYYLRDDEYPTEDYRAQTVVFYPGPQHMDGRRALQYVRTRHQDSDYGRRRRQEQLLVALFDRGKNIGIATRLPGALRSLAGAVQTNFTLEEQLALGRVALAMDRADIGLYSVDETMTSGWTTPGGAEVVRGNWPLIRDLIARAFARP
jgi:LCP family protein required for cell wall assembly